MIQQAEPLNFEDIIKQHIKDNNKSLKRMRKLTKKLHMIIEEFRRGL